jgi:hexosaminidase
VVRGWTGAVEGQTSREAYSLVVDAQGVRIVGASPAGVFYGLQSLRSLLPAPTPAKGLVLPALTVVDAPRFGYRGFMLDVARNFQPKPLVLRTLDLLARYKLNVFHFHLTEDEGWRVEMPSLPELTTVGARRGTRRLEPLPPPRVVAPGRTWTARGAAASPRRLRPRDPAPRRGSATSRWSRS